MLILELDFLERPMFSLFSTLQNLKTLPQRDLQQPIILWCTSGICTSEGGCDGHGGSQSEQDDKGNLESFI